MPLEDLVEDNEEDEGADVAENEEKDGETKKKKKRAVAYSDFAFTSKLMTLVNELKRVRDEDSTGTEFLGLISVKSLVERPHLITGFLVHMQPRVWCFRNTRPR